MKALLTPEDMQTTWTEERPAVYGITGKVKGYCSLKKFWKRK